MTTQSVPQNQIERKEQALQMLGQGQIPVQVNGSLWEVPSQTDPNRTYIVDTRAWVCSCPDSPHRCKHKWAVEIWPQALETVRQIASKHEMTHSQVAAQILSDLNSGVPKDKADRLQVLWQAAEHLADVDRREGKAREIVLHVLYRVGGRVIDSPMRIDRVFQDGQLRNPQPSDDPADQLRRTYLWLEANGYQRGKYHWIGDPQGHLRKRAEQFILQATA